VLEVRHLKLVREVAELGSVTQAAARLHLSQSAVSHQLVDLERELGTRLFDRVGKRMVPTTAGTRVAESARRMLGELCALEREIAELRHDAPIPLRVTTSCYTSYRWLPAALRHFAERHPRIDLTIVLEATRRAQQALLDDEVDVAILGAPPADRGLASAVLVTTDLCALVAPDHPVLGRGGRKRGNVRWSELRGHTVLVHEVPDDTMSRLEEAVRAGWLAESGERLPVPVTIRKVPLTEALLELARAGTGVAIVDRWIVEGLLGPDLCMLPLSPHAARSFHAVWRRGNPRALPLEELVQVIRAAGAVLPGAAPRADALPNGKPAARNAKPAAPSGKPEARKTRPAAPSGKSARARRR
jgi:LysR family transcriptional regulator for metE and metH